MLIVHVHPLICTLILFNTSVSLFFFFVCFLVFQEEDNEYRLDGFVVGDDDDSDTGKRRRNKTGNSSDSNKRKRLRKAREDHGMEAADDEDLELIREAQGVMYVPYRSRMVVGH